MSAPAAIGHFFRAVDERQWATVGELLVPEVELDYTSLFGGDVERVARAEIVARWSGMLPGFDATQHFIGPVIETAENRHECNVRGYHYLDDETWMVAGWYVLTTTTEPGESIMLDGITLIVSYETGSRSLIERAQERVSRLPPTRNADGAAPWWARRPAGSG